MGPALDFRSVEPFPHEHKDPANHGFWHSHCLGLSTTIWDRHVSVVYGALVCADPFCEPRGMGELCRGLRAVASGSHLESPLQVILEGAPILPKYYASIFPKQP